MCKFLGPFQKYRKFYSFSVFVEESFKLEVQPLINVNRRPQFYNEEQSAGLELMSVIRRRGSAACSACVINNAVLVA